MHKHARAHTVINKHIQHAHTLLGRYSEKVIAIKSVIVTYLILNATSNILYYILEQNYLLGNYIYSNALGK